MALYKTWANEITQYPEDHGDELPRLSEANRESQKQTKDASSDPPGLGRLYPGGQGSSTFCNPPWVSQHCALCTGRKKASSRNSDSIPEKTPCSVTRKAEHLVLSKPFQEEAVSGSHHAVWQPEQDRPRTRSSLSTHMWTCHWLQSCSYHEFLLLDCDSKTPVFPYAKGLFSLTSSGQKSLNYFTEASTTEAPVTAQVTEDK